MSHRRIRRVGAALLALVTLTVGCSDGANTAGSASASSSSAVAAVPQAVGETAAKKLDLDKMTEREKGEVASQLAKLSAPCDEPITLAQCIAEDRSCKACVPAGNYVAKMVRFGMPAEQRQKIYEARFDPKQKKNIDLGASPSKGPDDAVVTMVEWADFECSGCLAMRPLLEAMLERFPGQVRIVYKNYPLEQKHPNGLGAAKAAYSAQNQGKFWEMHKALFDNQGSLAPQDLTRIAKEVGLDMVTFRKDFSADATMKNIKEDMKQADALGLDGTPFIWANGRRPPVELFEPFFENFEEWLRLDIELAGQVPAKASDKYEPMLREMGIPVPGSSAAPAGSAEVAPSAAASAEPAPSAEPAASASAAAAPSASAKAP